MAGFKVNVLDLFKMEDESLFDHAAPTEGAVAAGWKRNLKAYGVTCGHRGRIEHQGGRGQ